MWEELEKFYQTLLEIEKAFYLIAAHDSELQAYGLKRLARWHDLNELFPLLDSFHIELESCKKIIEIVDKRKYDHLVELLKETRLEELITKFSVKLRIAGNERKLINPIALFLSAFSILFKRSITNDLFSNNDISMENVLAAITRIKSLTVLISNDLKDKFVNDDEIFKPSNINITQISVEIDTAIEDVKQSNKLSSEQQSNLIEYLVEAKVELAQKETSWRKVVGALVIASALLGGVAVAPQAAENINKAISYILGNAVPINYNNQFKLPKLEIDDEADPYPYPGNLLV